MFRTTADRIIATIDNNQFLALNSVNVGVPINAEYDLKYILGIINSKLMDFWYTLTVQEKNKTFAEVKIVYLERIPIIDLDKDSQKQIVDIVENRINESNNEKKQKLEGNIDLLVYNLYNLTYDEVLIVDPDTSITREEYEQ